VSPRGESIQIQLEQKGPGRYEGKFPTKEVGAYLINLLEFPAGPAREFASAWRERELLAGIRRQRT
jgi:hypothetical protein